MPDGAPTPGRPPLPIERWLARVTLLTGLDRGELTRLAIAFAVAIAAGLVFTWARLPLPWLLGPLTLSLVLSVCGRPLAQPHGLVLPVRTLLGVAVGASFTPNLAAKLWGTTLSLALLIPYMIGVTFLGTVFLVRFARFDRATAFFSAAPGGLADMILFAQGAGADLRRVTLVQAARLLATVFVLPFWLQLVGGLPLGGAVPRTLHIWQLLLVDAIVIGVLAWAGWRIADRLGLIGGSVVGPMLLSGLAHVLGLTEARVPVEALILTQITIGIVVGANFMGITLRELVSVLSWGFAFALLLVAGAAVMAAAMSAMTGIDRTTLLLSYAPGGQNEMAIIGLVLGLDVAIIALHHLVRVVVVVGGAQLVLGAHKDWRRPDAR